MRTVIGTIPLPGANYRGRGDVLRGWKRGDAFLVCDTFPPVSLYGAEIKMGERGHQRARKLGIRSMRVSMGPGKKFVTVDI